MRDVKAIGDAVIASVRSAIASAIAGVSARVDALAVRFDALPAGPRGDKGEPGESIRGERGESGLPGDPGPQGEQGVPGAAGLPGADGARGADGAPGPRGEMGERGELGPKGDAGPPVSLEYEDVWKLAERAASLVPKPTDGTNGIDGAPGRDGRDGLPGIAGLAGKDGASGKDGADGFSFDDFTMSLGVDGRTLSFKFQRASDPLDVFVERTIKLETLIYREVWREGDEYERGDVVTWGGSAWHCQQATTDKPGTSAAFRMMVKEGRPGKDGDAPPKAGAPVVRTK